MEIQSFQLISLLHCGFTIILMYAPPHYLNPVHSFGVNVSCLHGWLSWIHNSCKHARFTLTIRIEFYSRKSNEEMVTLKLSMVKLKRKRCMPIMCCVVNKIFFYLNDTTNRITLHSIAIFLVILHQTNIYLIWTKDRSFLVQGGYVSQSSNKTLTVSKKSNILDKIPPRGPQKSPSSPNANSANNNQPSPVSFTGINVSLPRHVVRKGEGLSTGQNFIPKIKKKSIPDPKVPKIPQKIRLKLRKFY